MRPAKQGGANFTRVCLVLAPIIGFSFVVLFLSSSTVSLSSFHVCLSSWNSLHCLSSRPNPVEDDKQENSHRVAGGDGTEWSDGNEKAPGGESDRLLEGEDQKRYNDTIHANAGTGENNTSGLLIEYVSENQTEPTQTEQVDHDAAIDTIEYQIQKLRHGARISARCGRNDCKTSCQGRGIFVHELPPKFNREILEDCNGISQWMDFCVFLSNQGKGRRIPRIGRSWYETNQFTLEPIFHSRIENHPCRVFEEDRASLFYIPFYAGLHIQKMNFRSASSDEKDRLGLELVQWLKTQRAWNQNQGKDHFLALGTLSWDLRRINNSWGTNFLQLEEMQNPFKLIIERQPWHLNDIGIPYPTSFHPRRDSDITRFQSKLRRSKRSVCASFAGAGRPKNKSNIRSILIKECMNSTMCTYLDCSSQQCENPKTVMSLLMNSEFCLQPPGDSATRKSFFDSMVYGCIPVVFSPFTAYYQYPWHLPEDHTLYSVYIDEEQVKQGNVDVLGTLKSIPAEKRKEMRRYIISELMPKIIYADRRSKLVKFRDAFTVSVDNLLDRVA